MSPGNLCPRPETCVPVGVIHWVTHAHALLNLMEWGYPEIATLGYAPHQALIKRPILASEAGEKPAADWAPWLLGQFERTRP